MTVSEIFSQGGSEAEAEGDHVVTSISREARKAVLSGRNFAQARKAAKDPKWRLQHRVGACS